MTKLTKTLDDFITKSDKQTEKVVENSDKQTQKVRLAGILVDSF